MSTSDDLTNEQKLSQLMDGEWGGLNAAKSVANICADEALKAKWARYHLARDAMKNEPLLLDQSLASRVRSIIDDEPAYTNVASFGGAAKDNTQADSIEVVSATEGAPRVTENLEANSGSTDRASWLNTGVAGFALAASVALVTVVGLNVFQTQDVAPGQSVASAEVNSNNGISVQSLAVVSEGALASEDAVLPEVEFVSNTGSFWVSTDSSQRVSNESQLNMMLSQHIENSPTSGLKGLLPYSRLVSYEETLP